MQPYSLYLHIPFCKHRCAYCDFNTYAGLEHILPDYVTSLCRELGWLAHSAESHLPVYTIFFGGGTPSLLPVEELEKILSVIFRDYELLPDSEVTLEANPGTLSLDYLRNLHQLGINRLSLGVQSADPGELRLLERQHDYKDVVDAVHWARQAGFDNINLDMIYGLPYQGIETWEGSLRRVLGLEAEHLSLYALTLEHGTPMQKWVARGLMAEPDADLAADMYDLAREMLDRHGYVQYEISNWARSSAGGEIAICRHNLQYWRLLPYLGFGAGAHGFVDSTHTANVLSPAVYIQRLQAADCEDGDRGLFPRTPASASVNKLDQLEEMGEFMMMGLRLVQEGVSDEVFRQRFGCGLVEVYSSQIEGLLEKSLLEWRKESLCLTGAARLLGNQVFVEFI